VSEYIERGLEIRELSKTLVTQFMRSEPACGSDSLGLKTSEIFRACGFDWGEKSNATSSSQQNWFVALLRELEELGVIERVESKQWRIK
jgi:hypothetical protein